MTENQQTLTVVGTTMTEGMQDSEVFRRENELTPKQRAQAARNAAKGEVEAAQAKIEEQKNA